MKEKSVNKRNRSNGPMGAAVFLFIIFFILGSGIWDEGFGMTLAIAALYVIGLAVRVRMDFGEDSSTQPYHVVEEKVNSDNTVVAQVMRYSGPDPYIGQVTRTYADGVFKREEKFISLAKAKVWLNLVYDEELTKHLLKVGIREKKIS